MAITQKELDKFFKKLSELSLDTKNSNIVCNYSNKFIDFDELKKIRKTDKLPLSPDMIFIHHESKEIWFVEFKSSTRENLQNKKFRIKRKILDGLIIFYEIFQDYYEFKKYYFVVYNTEESYEDKVLNGFSEKDIEFDLEEIEGKFLEQVFTDSSKSFIKKWKERFNIEFLKEEN